MTGPEHYAEAERLLDEMDYSTSADTLAAAQVHATLALVAATALSAANEVHATTGAGTDWDQIIGGAS